ncbi:BrnA antitoxin family protein [Melaminivora sp.]|uniref:BrnA antitoxin family protein n=1 Tax=Melaminivora sp. TaxID=1933032 RepID=UPI0028A93E81|nr:BrnA antitoxin family protein [Melaminivora sp.]
MSRRQTAEAVRAAAASGHHVWDGCDEDERPLSRQEMLEGMARVARKRGRPAGSGGKEQVAIRFDHEVLAAFRAAGPGWQTRINDALKDWLRTHRPG